MTIFFRSKNPRHPLAEIQAYQFLQEQEIAGGPVFSSDNNESTRQTALVANMFSGRLRDERRFEEQKKICTRAFIAAIGLSTVHNIDLVESCKHPNRGYMDLRFNVYCYRTAASHRRNKITKELFEETLQHTLSCWALDTSMAALSIQDPKLDILVRDIRKKRVQLSPRTLVDQSTITVVQNLCIIFGMLQAPDLVAKGGGVRNHYFDPKLYYKKELDSYLKTPGIKSIFAAPL